LGYDQGKKEREKLREVKRGAGENRAPVSLKKELVT